MSRLDHRLEPEGEVRRFEVITGAIGRRRWSADDRARILEETLFPGAVVSDYPTVAGSDRTIPVTVPLSLHLRPQPLGIRRRDNLRALGLPVRDHADKA